ncbi:hypothetical protein DUNSADRAFT_9964 [Dunaliella salina]|uniref:Uncharacterized protein n=1 Tax=Dunaliella salina TaxID=3046 RepID=A0ABQ7GGC9_DUNSA|nr:hypothetical protein DUNSADRAFT_9964 [Dunaliella salina]|eukprot:KAF5833654.1 hypothetical protein DUNSADRAFT_9964 [Dunaliella salina]
MAQENDKHGAGADGPGLKPAEDEGPQAKEATAGPQADGKQDGPAAAAAANEAVEALERRVPNLRKTGGVYVPPFKLARMMQDLQDQASPEYQRLTWENLVRGRGLFCRSLMKSQLASPSFSPVYSALVAVVNTKFPELGELLLHR